MKGEPIGFANESDLGYERKKTRELQCCRPSFLEGQSYKHVMFAIWMRCLSAGARRHLE